MKGKKIFAILLTITFLVSVVTLGFSFGKAATSKKLITITTHTTSSQPPAVTDLYKKKLREKFGIDLKTIYIPQSDYVTKMSLLFASNMAPDWIRALRPEYNLNEWIAAGYLIGFTPDEIKKKWPNYLKIWTKEEWDYLYKIVRYSDGKVYSFHGRRIAPVDMAFLYRKEIFDRYNLKFPTTVDEFYKTCIFLRQKTGKVVYLHANAVSGNLSLWAFTGIFLMYGLPELAPRQISYVDPLTKKFVPFAFNQNNYRQALILINKLYKAGCIWKEYATATRDQLDKFRTQGQGIIMWAYPANIGTYNNLYRNTDKDTNWVWSKDIPTAYPGKAYFFKRNPLHFADGHGFNSSISKEKLDRLLQYLNWALSEEGQIFHTYGEYGVTYKKEGNKYVYMDHIQTPTNPSGKYSLQDYGFPFAAPNGFMVAYPQAVETYAPIYAELAKTFLNRPKYYYIREEPMMYTKEEMAERAELESNIMAVVDEYCMKFVTGQLDPSNNKDWQQYLNVLNKVGLQRLITIRINAYNRAKK